MYYVINPTIVTKIKIISNSAFCKMTLWYISECCNYNYINIQCGGLQDEPRNTDRHIRCDQRMYMNKCANRLISHKVIVKIGPSSIHGLRI